MLSQQLNIKQLFWHKYNNFNRFHPLTFGKPSLHIALSLRCCSHTSCTFVFPLEVWKKSLNALYLLSTRPFTPAFLCSSLLHAITVLFRAILKYHVKHQLIQISQSSEVSIQVSWVNNYRWWFIYVRYFNKYFQFCEEILFTEKLLLDSKV